jgi:hypothetical protein
MLDLYHGKESYNHQISPSKNTEGIVSNTWLIMVSDLECREYMSDIKDEMYTSKATAQSADTKQNSQDSSKLWHHQISLPSTCGT